MGLECLTSITAQISRPSPKGLDSGNGKHSVKVTLAEVRAVMQLSFNFNKIVFQRHSAVDQMRSSKCPQTLKGVLIPILPPPLIALEKC